MPYKYNYVKLNEKYNNSNANEKSGVKRSSKHFGRWDELSTEWDALPTEWDALPTEWDPLNTEWRTITEREIRIFRIL
jgi:hypothetical protein